MIRETHNNQRTVLTVNSALQIHYTPHKVRPKSFGLSIITDLGHVKLVISTDSSPFTKCAGIRALLIAIFLIRMHYYLACAKIVYLHMFDKS